MISSAFNVVILSKLEVLYEGRIENERAKDGDEVLCGEADELPKRVSNGESDGKLVVDREGSEDFDTDLEEEGDTDCEGEDEAD